MEKIKELDRAENLNRWLFVSVIALAGSNVFFFSLWFSKDGQLGEWQTHVLSVLLNIVASTIVVVCTILGGWMYLRRMGRERDEQLTKFGEILEGYFVRVQPSICFFKKEGAKNAQGYMRFLRQVKKSLHMTHIDGDPPSAEVLREYRNLLADKRNISRIIFLQAPVTEARYGWIRDFGFHARLKQYVIAPSPELQLPQGFRFDDRRDMTFPPNAIPEDAALSQFSGADDEEKLKVFLRDLHAYRRSTKAMMMSFAIVDREELEALTAISLLREPRNDDQTMSFDDLLVVQGKKTADAFYEMFESIRGMSYVKTISNEENFKKYIACYWEKPGAVQSRGP